VSLAINSAGGIVEVTNTGNTTGVQGRTESPAAAGVYGEHVCGALDVGGNLDLGGNLNCSGACVSGSNVSKVGDADRLDGIDSGGFIQSAQGGSADGQAIAVAPNSVVFVGPPFGGLVRLRYSCPVGIGSNGTLRIINASGSLANLFVDSGGANPDYLQLSSGGFIDYPAAAGGDSFFIQMQGSPGVGMVQVATVHRNSSNDCHAQAIGVVAG
jgi:hypothetical protein